MEERPKYKMRFVGYDANGELKPTAPAFKKDEIRMLPLEYAQDMWWELIDAIPDLVIPEAKFEGSVFSGIFVPPEGQEKLVLPITADLEEVGVILYDEMTVKSLRLFIASRGGEVESEWRKPKLVEVARELEEARRAKLEESLKEASKSS